MILHAGLIALWDGARWRGALITGPSGAGKSDLALRALDLGFILVADDQVEVWASGGRLWGAPPPVLAGLLEVRGEGVVVQSHRAFARIDLICAGRSSGEIERMPDAGASQSLLSIEIPQLELAFREASAPVKLRRALMGLGTGTHKA